ncbi:hypothetical protein G7Y79_00047g082930 [Physcia stellaris]|nr:hypothetical protein G7Y79_00047g082930 [Physcia stellaris]
MDTISPPTSPPNSPTHSHQEVIDFWRPKLSKDPSSSPGLSLMFPSSSAARPIKEEDDNDDEEGPAALFLPLLQNPTTFSINGPLFSNDSDSDDSDFESEPDDEEMEDIASDEPFEFAQDEDDDVEEFLEEPRKLAQEKKMKEEAARERWAKLKLPVLKEECVKRGLAKGVEGLACGEVGAG